MSLILEVKTKIDKRGLKKLERFIQHLDDSVEVGFFGGTPHPKNRGSNTIAEVAAINEYGLGVPKRPFFDATFQEHQNYKRHLQTASKLLITGKLSKSKVFKDIGEAVKGDIQSMIADNDFQPNHPSTIARKGEDDPLSETGAMERDVSYRIK